MSDINPQASKIKLGENEYGVIFTIKAIDDIQEHFNISISDFSELFINSEDPKANLCYVLALAINEATENQVIDEKIIDELINEENAMSTAKFVFAAFSSSLPESNSDGTSGEEQLTDKVNVARLLFIGKTLLGYSESEAWRMTPRKLILLYQEYQKEHGQYEAPQTIDSIIPF